MSEWEPCPVVCYHLRCLAYWEHHQEEWPGELDNTWQLASDAIRYGVNYVDVTGKRIDPQSIAIPSPLFRRCPDHPDAPEVVHQVALSNREVRVFPPECSVCGMTVPLDGN